MLKKFTWAVAENFSGFWSTVSTVWIRCSFRSGRQDEMCKVFRRKYLYACYFCGRVSWRQATFSRYWRKISALIRKAKVEKTVHGRSSLWF